MTMIKGILLPIRAEYLVRILNGEKTKELRDSLPKDFKEGWIYLYCTKALPRLFNRNSYFVLSKFKDEHKNDLNGKVVARFWFDKYDTIYVMKNEVDGDYYYVSNDNKINYVDKLYLNTLQLTYQNVQYVGTKKAYAWHIKQLEIFDKPKKLSDFNGRTYEGDETIRHQYWDEEETLNEIYLKPLTKAPQSWQYVYIKEKE